MLKLPSMFKEGLGVVDFNATRAYHLNDPEVHR
jgi:hypothetical protein